MSIDPIEQRWIDLDERIIACRKCPRLVAYREEIGRKKKRAYMDWRYWARPVPGFGDHHGRVLIVGLAPGAHGANRTGRMFTGDSSGNFLFRALYKAGFANQPTAHDRDDGLELHDLYIAAVCRCAPPDNKPTRDEILNCRPYLLEELELLGEVKVVVVLGRIAFDDVIAVYRQQGHAIPRLEFMHGAVYPLGEGMPTLVCSYHPSQQNTQTGRLSEAMFDQIWERVRTILNEHPRGTIL